MDIIVSNRIAKIEPGAPMIGGLASALLPAVKKAGTVWFGSSGRLRSGSTHTTPLVQVESYGRGTIATVDLPEQHYAGYYEGFANSVLWPLMHSRPELAQIRADDYGSYIAINRYMAKTLAAFGSEDATFWIHDYHFLPLALEMRRLGITRKIGFFLHTPWPTRRVMAQLPQFRELAEAMLAYDLIGFQTDIDRENFAELVRYDLHTSGKGNAFKTRFGTCRLGTFPIGIDAQQFAENAIKGDDDAEVQRLKTSLNGAALIIGVDRVDYSKGLVERMQAFDRVLTQHADLKRRLSMVQIGIPSRTGIDTYRDLNAQLACTVGDINARHGEIDWTPVRYINRGYGQATLSGFYRASAVGLITPLADGMNLVAKEYVAAQNPDDPGVLVLSKFAGASQELDAALLVDPNDIDGVARSIAAALTMPRTERRARWQHNMNVLLTHPIHAWFAGFMQELKLPRANVVPIPPATVAAARASIGFGPFAAAHS